MQYLPIPLPSLGDDVWSGDKAIRMTGITIGDVAIIVANTMVIQPVAPYAIISGNFGVRAETIVKP